MQPHPGAEQEQKAKQDIIQNLYFFQKHST